MFQLMIQLQLGWAGSNPFTLTCHVQLGTEEEVRQQGMMKISFCLLASSKLQESY